MGAVLFFRKDTTLPLVEVIFGQDCLSKYTITRFIDVIVIFFVNSIQKGVVEIIIC